MSPHAIGLACAAVTLMMSTAVAAQTPERPDTLPDSTHLVSDTTRLSSDTLKLAGSRVRGVLANGARFVGIVRAVHGDTLVMREQSSPGVPRAVPAASLRRLQVQRDSRAARLNAQIGGAIGALAGGLAYLNLCDKHPSLCRTCERSSYDDDEQQDDELDLGSAMVLGGALVGSAIGYALTPRRWRTVGVSVSGAVAPMADGTAIASLGARVPLRLGGRR